MPSRVVRSSSDVRFYAVSTFSDAISTILPLITRLQIRLSLPRSRKAKGREKQSPNEDIGGRGKPTSAPAFAVKKCRRFECPRDVKMAEIGLVKNTLHQYILILILWRIMR